MRAMRGKARANSQWQTPPLALGRAHPRERCPMGSGVSATGARGGGGDDAIGAGGCGAGVTNDVIGEIDTSYICTIFIFSLKNIVYISISCRMKKKLS